MITTTILDKGGSDGSATSYNTNSITIPEGKLVLLACFSQIASGTANEPTVSGWTKVISVAGTVLTWSRVSLFRVVKTSPASGAITISFGATTNTRCYWAVIQCNNAISTGTNGADGIVQSASAEGYGVSTGLTVTLSAFSNVNNATLGFLRFGAAGPSAGFDQGSGFTNIADYTAGVYMNTEFKTTNDTTVNWTWDSSDKNVHALAVELKAQPSGGPFLLNFV